MKLSVQEIRNNFLEKISRELEYYGFRRSADEFTVDQNIRTGGQTMIINGQRYEDPGQIIPIKMIVRALGTGEVWDDATPKDYFECFAFRIGVRLGDKYEERGIDSSIYYNEPERFMVEFKQIFNIR